MARKSPASITVDPNVRCIRAYPAEDAGKHVRDLRTVRVRAEPGQAIHVARALLAVSQQRDNIAAACRFEKRKSDDTYHITVTGK